MPQMDGLTATREIRAEYPDAHIVIITSSEGVEQEALRDGAEAVILKDAPREELLRTITDACHTTAT